MKLVTNDGEGHRAEIGAVLDGSEVFIAVAFLKRAGASLLSETLSPALAKGGTARVFVGADFFLTEPDALEELSRLASRHKGLRVHLGTRSRATFHPKTYASFGVKGLKCLTGSANLTGGALGANIEASIRVDCEADSTFAIQLRAMFEGLRTGGRFRLLDAMELNAYRSAWRLVSKARRQLDKAMAKADIGALDRDGLDGFRKAYLADPENLVELERREKNRRKACSVQRKIAALGEWAGQRSARDRLLADHLQDLMSSNGGRHLWSSGDIHRTGGGVLSRPKRMIALFRDAEAAARLPVEEGYAIARDIALELRGAGPNMVTEILCTYAPKRYPVINGNTVGALARLGLNFPGSSGLGLVKPARYAEIVGLIDAVRDRIGAKDYPETDAFLNWVYRRPA